MTWSVRLGLLCAELLLERWRGEREVRGSGDSAPGAGGAPPAGCCGSHHAAAELLAASLSAAAELHVALALRGCKGNVTFAHEQAETMIGKKMSNFLRSAEHQL